MTNRVVDISEDSEAILLSIATRLPGVSSLSLEEKLEVAIEALISSYDAGVEAIENTMSGGKPIDANELRRLIEEKLNPNISVGTMKELGESEAVVEKRLTLEEIKNQAPTNTIVHDVLVQDAEDIEPELRAVLVQAIEDVFAQLPQEKWDEESTRKLVVSRMTQLMAATKSG